MKLPFVEQLSPSHLHIKEEEEHYATELKSRITLLGKKDMKYGETVSKIWDKLNSEYKNLKPWKLLQLKNTSCISNKNIIITLLDHYVSLPEGQSVKNKQTTSLIKSLHTSTDTNI